MGVRSTIVKCVSRYRLQYEDGSWSDVMEIAYVDPADPASLKIDRTECPSTPVEFISLSFVISSLATATRSDGEE
jgi:hypothetical protein